MVTKLTLWVLPLLLFFLMNRHGISGRDLKVELQDDTDTNSQSYINHEKPNEPYITSYATSSNKLNYLTGYKTGPHGSDKDFSLSSTNKPYITGYTTTPRDAKLPYITQYSGNTNFKGDSNAPYITQYGDEPSGSNKEIKTKSATAQDSAKPYLTSYGPRSKETQSSNVDHTEAFKVGFFAIDDLYVGNIMTLQFPVEEFSHFLSKKEADSIPFSIPQLPSVLQLFSISEDSAQAKSMRGTIEQCEAGTITGETKICANSLESMLEFVHNIIGSEEKHNIHTTTPSSGAPLQKYTILKISQDIYAPKWVACHPLPYPYAVYYCHFISTGTRVFKVLLDGENGDKVEALGVCHLDTSDWSPNHILFKQLGFMPGEAPVCHFFPVKHLMWVPQPSTATV
ncbi:BURP domain-containing protein BNM2A isoform X3 [Arachis duranensis]|uniref:BURP domain-containing protein BNM2A isoform X3 n=1 Tax=Arachis duranensis TaxID=130453 RepID=A0A9C6TIR2_ARADU|nr:BURP domain-containing protein BNM2A isoform X3 [Arachis duranensis]